MSKPTAQDQDEFTRNPYPAGHPKYAEFEEKRKKEKRLALQSRYSQSQKLRLVDYDGQSAASQNYLQKAAAASRSASPISTRGEQRARGGPKPVPPEVTERFRDVALGSGTAARPTCTVAIHGGATIWVGHADGTVSVLRGADGTFISSFSVHCRPNDSDTPLRREVMAELEGGDVSKARPKPKQGNKTNKGETNSTGAKDTEKGKKKEEDTSSGVTAMTVVTPSAVAIGLSDGRLLLWSSLNLLPVACADPDNAVLGTGAVTTIVNLDDSSLVTATDTGFLSRWTFAEEPLPEGPGSHVVLQQVAKRAHDCKVVVTASKKRVYAAIANGQVGTVDLDDMGFGAFEDKVIAAPTAIAYANGFLAVAYSKSVALYNTTTKARVERVKLGVAITVAIADSLAGRFWLVDEKGGMVEMEADARSGFARRLSVPAPPPPEEAKDANKKKEKEPAADKQQPLYTAGSLFAHADAARLWTLASNGLNIAWWTEYFKAQCEAADADEDIRAALNRDERIIEDGRAATEAKVVVVERRRLATASAVGAAAQNALMRVYFSRFYRYGLVRRHKRKHPLIANALAVKSHHRVLRVAYTRWMRNARSMRQRKQQLAAAGYLAQRGQQSLMGHAYRIWLRWHFNKKTAVAVQKRVAALAATNGKRLVVARYAAWTRLVSRHRDRARQRKSATILAGRMEATFFALWFDKWRRVAVMKKHLAAQARTIATMLSTTNTSVMRGAYTKLLMNVRRAKNARVVMLWGSNESEERRTELRARYFGRLLQHAAVRRRLRIKNENTEATKVLDQREKQAEAAKERVAKLKQLRALREKLSKTVSQRDELTKELYGSALHEVSDAEADLGYARQKAAFSNPKASRLAQQFNSAVAALRLELFVPSRDGKYLQNAAAEKDVVAAVDTAFGQLKHISAKVAVPVLPPRGSDGKVDPENPPAAKPKVWRLPQLPVEMGEAQDRMTESERSRFIAASFSVALCGASIPPSHLDDGSVLVGKGLAEELEANAIAIGRFATLLLTRAAAPAPMGQSTTQNLTRNDSQHVGARTSRAATK